jgi:hypothetical protein
MRGRGLALAPSAGALMGLLAFVLLGLFAWGWIFYHLDRPSIPAWRVRDAYRVASLILFFLLLMTCVKMASYRAELRTLIHYCR